MCLASEAVARAVGLAKLLLCWLVCQPINLVFSTVSLVFCLIAKGFRLCVRGLFGTTLDTKNLTSNMH
jgi:hypothetical protein